MAGLELGIRYDTTPIPPVPEDTTYFDVGELSIGVEYRLLNDEILDDNFKSDSRQAAIIDAARPAMIDDKGVSLHVCDRESGVEYLRFDIFDNEPHYHYIRPGECNIVIPYDRAASGDMFAWAIECIQSRVQPMLDYCGALDLSARINAQDLAAGMPAVIEAANAAVAAVAAASA